MRLWAKSLAAAMAALALLAAPAAAQVPDPYARELARKLAWADGRVAEEGYGRAAGPFAGGLASGESGRHVVTLRAGQDYRVVGVCDDRCSDLGLRVADAGGQVLGADIVRDPVSVVRVRPQQTGAYAIDVEMARCELAQCWYAFNVYTR
jgi:hypothetical protein